MVKPRKRAKLTSLMIRGTYDYAKFARDAEDNRSLSLKDHRNLVHSMKKYGFLICFPIVCLQNGDGVLIIKDGQHRWAIAELLGLPVYYVVVKTDFDTAEVNSTSKLWSISTYYQKYVLRGFKAYQELKEFVEKHQLESNLGIAIALLAGQTSYSNVKESFCNGQYKIKDRAWADDVASLHSQLLALSPNMRGVKCVQACMALCRVPEFDSKRLLTNSGRCRDKLVAFRNRDAYLVMFEEIYNYGRHEEIGLKAMAVMAMKERRAANKKSPLKTRGR